MIHFTCACGQHLTAPAASAGQTIPCPGCGTAALVPAAVAAGPANQPTEALTGLVAPEDAGERPTDPATCDLNATVAPAESASRRKRERTENTEPEGPSPYRNLGGYRILRELGQGGMGMVYEAEDLNLERRVSLKVMKPEIARNPRHRERFLREACTAASVNSLYICPIYEVGEADGVPFIAMPFLEGEALNQHWKKGQPLPIEEVVRIGMELAEGLSAAHEAGLVHRDIKPANIWLETQPTGPPRAIILDFGLARVQDDSSQITQSGVIVGTPAYMSPEQARGEKQLDARTDLFSLGIVLYALATGELPFKGTQMMDVLLALATQEPAPPCTLVPTMPRPLSDLILRLLAKHPDARPSTARAVVDDLAAIERGFAKPLAAAVQRVPKSRPVATSGDTTELLPSRTSPRAKPRQTSPLWYAVIAVGLLGFLSLLGAGGVYYFVTDTGAIEIQTDAANVRVSLLRDGKEIDVLDAASKRALSVRTGTYTVRLKDGRNDVEIAMPDRFELGRGTTHVIAIRRRQPPEAPQPVALGPAVSETKIMGGAATDNTNRDQAPAGGVLIGFHVGLGEIRVGNEKTKVIDAVQPIYRTAAGEVLGRKHGANFGGDTVTVKARPNYAVSGITIKVGDCVDGFSVKFARQGGDMLDLEDTYQSEWVGGHGGGAETALGDNGLPAVGMVNRINQRWPFPGMGLLTERLHARLALVLRGQAQPADNGERVKVAQIAFYQKEYAAAARLYDEALTKDPALADDRVAQHRYRAARALVRAAANEGKDAVPLDAVAQAKLRAQAREWLKAELTARNDDPRHAVQTLARWQQSADLAGVRDPVALAKLPADEQKACTQFWQDVAKAAADARTKAIPWYEAALAKEPENAALAGECADLLLASHDDDWIGLTPVKMEAKSGARMEQQADASIFVHQNPPGKNDTYVLEFDSELKHITGLRLETIPDARLPHGGSGWYTADGNFFLNELTLEAAAADDPATAKVIALRNATADFSQPHYSVRNAIDGDAGTGWAVGSQADKMHAAFFATAEKLGDGNKLRLTVRLHQGMSSGRFLLGRFRLSVSANRLSAARALQRLGARRLTDPWAKLATAYALDGRNDPALAYFGRALQQANAYEARKPIIASAAHFDSIVTALVERHPDDPQLQLALARHLAARGTRQLAEKQTAQALAHLTKAHAIYQRLFAPADPWTVLTPVEMTSEKGAKMDLQADGSIFVHQRPNAKGDTYALVFPSTAKGIRAVRLEALTDPRLPLRGPGWNGDGNFWLNELTLRVAPDDRPDEVQAIAVKNACADFSQFGPTLGLLDGNGGSIWGIWPALHRNHTAICELADPVGDGQPLRLSVRLRHRIDGVNLGRFRVSVTSNPAAVLATRLRWELHDGDLAQAHTALARAYAERGQTNEAVAAFAEALAAAEDHTGKARVVAEAARLDGMLEKLAEPTAGDGRVQVELGQHFAALGKAPAAAAARARARTWFEAQLAHEPENAALAAELADLLLAPGVTTIVPTSETAGITWRFTSEKPADEWTQPDFKDAGWQEGVAPFGTADIQRARTPWTTPDIWLRRRAELADAKNVALLFLRVYCDDRAEVFLNGKRVAGREGHTKEEYVLQELEQQMRDLLRPGANILAVHCHNIVGPGYIDIGLYAATDGSLTLAKRRVAALGIVDPEFKLGAAYAVNGRNDKAAQCFSNALERADGFAARKPILEAATHDDEVIAALAKAKADDPQVRLALARSLLRRGKQVLADKQPATAQAVLEQARDCFQKVPKGDHWSVLTPVEMSTDNGVKMEVLQDRSIFVHQPKDAKHDGYTLAFECKDKGICGLRLETLADDRLPHRGPGWSASNGNFALGELTLLVAPADHPEQARAIRLTNPWADYSQPGLEIRYAIDSNPRTGWAVDSGRTHNYAAVFDLAENVGGGRPLRLTVRLDQHHQYGADHNLGRFRLAFTTDRATLEATRLRFDLKPGEEAEVHEALGQSQAQQGQTKAAAQSFAAALGFARDRATRNRIIASAAPAKGVLEELAERPARDPLSQAALASYFVAHGRKPLADALAKKARTALEQRLAAEPDNTEVAAGLAGVLESELDYVWIDDAPPPGANLQGDTPWEFVEAPLHPVFRGKKSMRRQGAEVTQHFFESAPVGLRLGDGARLFAYVFLDPQDLPKTIMLQFCGDGQWDRVFWGEDLIPWGEAGTPSRLLIGPLPKAGEWVRLEVDAARLRLPPGTVLTGWAFTQYGGTCYWDAAGTTRLGCETPWQALAVAYHRLGDQPALDRLLERHPTAAAGIGDLYAVSQDWDRAFAAYQRACRAEPIDAKLVKRVIEIARAAGHATTLATTQKIIDALVSAGRTREAVPVMAELSAATPKDTALFLKVAALQAWFGQPKELAATRQRLLAFARDNEPDAANDTARACSVAQFTDKAQLEAMLELARTAAKTARDGPNRDLVIMSLGMAEYRSGNDVAAEEALLAAVKPGANRRHLESTCAFYRAMILFRQGKHDQARDLARAAAATITPLPSDDNHPLANGANHDDLIVWLAYKEARALIRFDAPPPKGGSQ